MVMGNLLSSAKLWLGLGVVAAAGFAVWHYTSVISENERLTGEVATQKQTIKAKEAEIARSKDLLADYEQRVARAEKNREDYLTRLKGAEDETEKLRDCIDNGRGCGLRVRTVQTKCPVSEANPGADGTEAGYAELDPSARQSYYALRNGIIQLESLYAWCQRELADRSTVTVD